MHRRLQKLQRTEFVSAPAPSFHGFPAFLLLSPRLLLASRALIPFPFLPPSSALFARLPHFPPPPLAMEGAEGAAATMPSTVAEVYEDYKGRRAGMIKALTSEVENFYDQCDPVKENLCLYGNPNGTWEVNYPAEEVPPELPEPALGINFARDGMKRKDWLSLVAVHSDSWLYAVSFYYCARFNKQERKHLFNMINELPTVFEVVSGRKSMKEKAAANNGASKSKSSAKKQERPSKQAPPPTKEEEETLEEEEEEHDATFCGACGAPYTPDEFWIGCDVCEDWFHGKCVKITEARAEHIKQYKCPSCTSNKRARP